MEEKQKCFRYNKNTTYALYSNEDEYIVGFDKIKDIADYIGYKRGCSLSMRIKDFTPQREQFIWNEGNTEIISELIYMYPKKLKIKNGILMERGAKIYRFTERKKHDE